MTKTDDAARAILEGVGGNANIAALQHCSTRLRFTIVDDAKVDEAGLQAVPGVIGVVTGPQPQVVVGTRVADYHRALERLRGAAPAAPASRTPLSWRRVGSTIMEFVVSVFVPIIPAIAGAGIFKSLLVLLAAVGWMDSDSQSYLVLTAIADAVFYFLPLLVAYTTAKRLSVNVPLSLGIVSLLLFPSLTTLVAQDGGVALLGMQVPNVAYNAQVFPAILTVLLLWGVERVATRWTPGPIRVFFVPFVCFVIVSPIMLFLLGPLGYWAGGLLTGAMLWLYATLGWVAIALLAGLLPFVISVGMHKAFIPPTIATVAEYGRESFYLVASLAHNLAESGSSLAVAIRTKSRTLRGTAISAGVSAFFGITEPALYGVTLQNRRALISVIVGSVIGGAYLGITLVDAFVVVGPGAASISMYIDPADPWNLIHAVIGLVISFGVGFVLSIVLWRDGDSATVRALHEEPVEAIDDAATAGTARQAAVVAPVDGVLGPLADVDDAVFSAGILGEGVAITPTSGVVRAPVSGELVSLLPTKHAIGIRADDGTEILVHVGIDTVQLDGAPFIAHVEQGDRVTQGQLLLEVDLDAIAAAGLDSTTPIVVLDDGATIASVAPFGPTHAGTHLFDIMKKEHTDATA